MAKYFLIFFSLMLCLSIAVFTVTNFTDLYPKEDLVSPAMTPVVPTNITTANKVTDAPTDKVEPQTRDNEETSAKGIEQRFQPDVEIEKKATTTSPTNPSAQNDSLDFSTFYITKVKPFIQKIFGEQEVQVKTQNKDALEADASKGVFQTQTEPLTPESQSQDAETLSKDTEKKEAKALDKLKAKTTVTTKKTSEPKKAQTSTWKSQPKGTGWSIQIAAFRTEAETKGLVKKLEAEKIPNYTYETQVDGLTWYRVTIGPFESPAAAASYKQSHNIGRRFKGAFVRKL